MPNSSATVRPYPHYRINVIDKSKYVPVPTEALPLHRPIYFMKTQKGIPGVPVWCESYNKAVQYFGEETFNMLNPLYFSQQAYFLLQTFPNNGAFICRMVDNTATSAFVILECTLEQKNIPQYEKDADGNRTVDENGDWIPQMTTGDTPVAVTNPGVELTWSVRTALLTGETDLASLPSRTSNGKTTYPMLAFADASPGASGNNNGFKLWYDSNVNDITVVNRVGSVFYTFAPITKLYGESTVDPIYDLFSSTYNSFVMKPNTVDNATSEAVSIDKKLATAYPEGYQLPYQVYTFSENFQKIGNKCVQYLKNTDPDTGDQTPMFDIPDDYNATTTTLGFGWMVNLISGRDLNDKYYDQVAINTTAETATPMTSAAIHYLAGGSDGDLTDTAIETEIRGALALTLNPDIQNPDKYPFNYIYDVGFSLQTKYALCDFLNYREDVKVILSTQRVTTVGGTVIVNSKDQDLSTGTALRARALLSRESIVKGTECCRVSIFCQSGLTNDNYAGWLPMTLWHAMKKAEYQNKDYLDQEPKGLPNSAVTMFRQLNWDPSSEDLKNLYWINGLNYAQYYNMSGLHVAVVRSVYTNESSVLVDDTFTDAIIHMKNITRINWHVFAGVTEEVSILQKQIHDALERDFAYMLNGKYAIKLIKVYQTDEEKKLGYIQHILIQIEGGTTSRVWDVDIVCYPDGGAPAQV